jgi:hypothetical protein
MRLLSLTLGGVVSLTKIASYCGSGEIYRRQTPQGDAPA